MLLGYKCFMCVLWIMTATTLMWSCQSHSQPGRTANASSTSGTNSSSAPTQTSAQNQLGDIRAVDFKNFTYPWYPTFLKSDSREIKLQNGELEIEENRKAGVANLSLPLADVSYVKLKGDDKEQAIVTVSGIAGVNRFTGAVFVYAVDHETPTLL